MFSLIEYLHDGKRSILGFEFLRLEVAAAPDYNTVCDSTEEFVLSKRDDRETTIIVQLDRT